MATPSLYVDYMNADSLGRVRLNCVGTTEDLDRLKLRLVDGMKVLVHDDELEAEGEVSFSVEEKLWVAKIDWNALHPFTEIVSTQRV